MGQLTASIAHEVIQPIAAGITSARAALRCLGSHPPDLAEVQRALGRIVNEGNRATDVIDRIRSLIKKAPPRKDDVKINEAILEFPQLDRQLVRQLIREANKEQKENKPPAASRKLFKYLKQEME